MGRKRKSFERKASQMKLKRCKLGMTNDAPETSTIMKRTEELQNDVSSFGDISLDNSQEYILIKLKCLQQIVDLCKCSHCNKKSLSVHIGKNYGLAQDIILKCACNFSAVVNSSDRLSTTSNHTPYDVNRRSVHAFSELGKGHAGSELFCTFMNLPCMDSRTFSKHLKFVKGTTIISVQSQLEDVRRKVRQSHIALNSLAVSDAEIVDIAVSFDASWHTRGHSSNYSVACIIDVLTGFVIDYDVSSKHCNQCKAAEHLGRNTAEFDIWYGGHLPVCEKNFVGASGGMEVAMGKRLWSRSTDIGFRYVEFVGDGDSRTFDALQKMKVYGPEIVLIKEECVNHVGKRMGTALRNLVAVEKKRGITLGGRKHGHLKDTTIKKITRYYQNAIIRNKHNILAMKTDIYAILQHCSSTDRQPKHKKCPFHSESWCFYNRALSQGHKPPSHSVGVSTPLTSDIVCKMMPIFQRLASDSLLKRCSKGETQNRNESLHSMVWSRCPKSVNGSKQRVGIAAARGIMDFNKGLSASILIIQKQASLSPGRSHIHTRYKDCRRHKKFVTKSTLSFKAYRRKVSLAKIKLNQKKNSGYLAGGH